MVEVFKTNIELEQEAGLVLKKIEKQIPNSRITFDLEDCDHILRVESGSQINPNLIIEEVSALGFQVSILPDEV
ncbi:MAG: hypothetical protein CMC96_13085 [Flavobacteriales bacterium]|nr:hypothetical protein [Flavobacteriales bacterium]|tara:strand:+ start:6265 stop:6486 length:222 start_codon:yes stop_codon:yes gene_type:complete